MNPKIKLLLATFAVVSCAQVFADDCSVETEATKSRTRKFDCVRINQLNVCGTETVNTLLVTGNETVDGSATAGTLAVLGAASIGGGLTVTSTVIAGGFALAPAPAAGTPGVPGIGGDLAYGIVTNETLRTLASGSPITFDTVGTESGETGSAAGISITTPGVYRMQFLARALPTTFADPVIFALENNAAAIANAQFTSAIVTSTATVTGAALVNITTVPAAITVVNTSVDTVTLPADGSVNAYLLVERIAA